MSKRGFVFCLLFLVLSISVATTHSYPPSDRLVSLAASESAVLPASQAVSVPEIIDNGHYMAGTEQYIYYSTDGNIEVACEALVGDVYGRVPNGGGRADKVQLRQNCRAAPFPDMAMESTSKETYFISHITSTNSHALFSRPTTGSEAATKLTGDQNIAPRALALDNQYLYYVVLNGTSSQIVRRDINSGVTEAVVAVGDMVGGSINGLAVDNIYLYWTEGGEGEMGRVRRALKTGSAPTELANNLALPISIEAYGNYVYWAEEEGHRLARIPKGGAIGIDSLYETDRPVTALHLHDDVLYFGTGTTGTTSGSLWRIQPNGNNPTLMSYGFPPPRDILWAENFIYWVDGKFRRLPPDAVSDVVDYRIERIEVTQGVQDGSHTVPLIINKPTMVRVYSRELVGTSADQVTAKLYGYSDGVALPGSPLSPVLNSELDLEPTLPTRVETTKTYVFSLPQSWIEQFNLDLQAEVNPNQQLFETDFNNNLYPKMPEPFETNVRIACLVTYPVAATTPTGSTVIFDNDPAVYDPRIIRMRAMLPTLVNVVKSPTVIWLVDEDGQQVPHNLPADPDEAALLAAIEATGQLSDPPTGCIEEVTRFGGIVDVTADFDPDFGGRANGNSFWARWWDAPMAVDYIQPAGGFLWAHELAHTLDRPHVDCKGASNPGFYPYADPCTNDDSNDDEAAWGYDLISGAALDPLTHSDLMAYGSQRWVSDFTWKCLFDFIGDQWELPGTGIEGCTAPFSNGQANHPITRQLSHEAGEGFLFIQGMISGTDDIEISIFAYQDPTHLTSAQTAQLNSQLTSGQWTVLLKDGVGQVVASAFINPQGHVFDSDGHHSTQFFTGLERPAQTAVLEIRESATNQLIYQESISQNAPSLSVSSALINLAGELVVELEAEDPDNDPVQVIVQYIEPDGRKQLVFQTRGVGQSAFRCTPCIWPGRTLHGGNGIIRVFVSDGFHTMMSEQPVNVPTHPPEVSLTAVPFGHPDEEGLVTYGVWAEIWDAEDGSPAIGVWNEPVYLDWRINGTRVASNEPILFLSHKVAAEVGETDLLLTIELIVTDNDGQTAVSEIELDLSESQALTYLPLLRSP